MIRRALVAVLLFAILPLAAGCYDKGDYSPTEPPALESLTLSTAGNRTTLPADGVSRLRVVAQIRPDSDPDKRTVVFTTSAGQWIGGTGNTATERSVTADSSGQAALELQSAQQVGDATITASVQGVASLTRSLVIAFVAASPDDVIRFTAAPSSAPADGATVSRFTVQLSPALPLGTPVQFRTTMGTFLPEGTATATRTPDGSYAVTADLASPATLGSARVSATANNVTREVTFDLVRALPDRITVSTNNVLTVAPGGTLSVIATLERDIGTVTAGTVATFRATANGQPLGFFREITPTDGTGKATATFVVGETTFRGRATITVGAEGTGVTGSTIIEIVDPS